MAYTKTQWVNNQAPALDADHLNHIEQGIKDAHDGLDEKADAADLDDKVDKVTGKGLSTEDYTTAEKTKLAGIAAGAEANVQSDWNQTTTTADDYIKNKPTIPTKTSDLTNDSGFLTQHQDISGKQDTLVSGTNIKTINSMSLLGSGNIVIEGGGGGGTENIADEYSASSTYAVGDYCIYDGQLYRCTTAITTAEAWTAAHWTMATVGEELTDLKGDIPQNVSDLTNDSGFQTGTQVNTAIELALTSYKNVYRVDLPSFSSLPLTFSNAKITADHEIINAVLGTPSAQTSDWTLTPTAGSATLSGSISGSTTLTLYIAEVESLTVT